MSLYVDGCSFAAATGLSAEYKLANLLGADRDMSLEGKSNMQIVKDLEEHINEYDEFVLAFTFSNRFVVFLEGKRPLNILPHPSHNFFVTEEEYDKYRTFHRFYYEHMNIEFNNKLSDFYVDGVISLLKTHNKKYVIYTTESRNCKYKLEVNLMPYCKEFMNDDNHFNEIGMKCWADDARRRLDEFIC